MSEQTQRIEDAVDREEVGADQQHGGGGDKESAATILVGLARAQYYFGVSGAGETFSVPRKGPKVVRLLRGGKTSLRAGLSREYFQLCGTAAPSQALTDALLCIQGMAENEDESELSQRVARHNGDLWLDLGDKTGKAAKITAEGWSIEERAPVYFRRTTINGALPIPRRDGNIDELWRWLNVEAEDRPLVIAWLIAALFRDIPHPILGLFGEQGTGKSTIAKLLVSLLDPGPAPTRKAPRDAEAWVTAAAGSWVVALDNLSDIAPWLSDSLCRAVTGDGDIRRKLYTDGELAVFAFRRCVIINGIDVGALRGDLAERLLPINLELISEQLRLTEEDLWPAWEKAHPRQLGALLDLACEVLRRLPSVELARKPRMADFARILAAVDSILRTGGLERYITKQSETAKDSLTGDPFIMQMMKVVTNTFEGSSSALLEKVTPTTEKWRSPKGWPGEPRKVTGILKRHAPALRRSGWDVENDDAENHDKVIRWRIIPPDEGGKSSPQSPQPPQGQETLGSHANSGAGIGAGMRGDADSSPQSPPQENRPETRTNTAPAGNAGNAGMKTSPSLEANVPEEPCRMRRIDL